MTYAFDMDGTLNRFYEVPNWLNCLLAEDTTPYLVARPLVNMSLLARLLNKVQREGHKIGIISWSSKEASKEYDIEVEKAKRKWLAKHLPSVKWDFIHVVSYGTNKWETCGRTGILFDDEERNRVAWENGLSYSPDKIFEVLKAA